MDALGALVHGSSLPIRIEASLRPASLSRSLTDVSGLSVPPDHGFVERLASLGRARGPPHSSRNSPIFGDSDRQLRDTTRLDTER